MTDNEFADQFAACTLAPAEFNHRGHVRIAWINLQRHAFDHAVRLTCEGIRAYATSLGAAGKFHWTITEALMRLLYAGGAADTSLGFAQFLERNAALLEDARGRIALHYTDALLATEAARSGFVQADREPLPEA